MVAAVPGGESRAGRIRKRQAHIVVALVGKAVGVAPETSGNILAMVRMTESMTISPLKHPGSLDLDHPAMSSAAQDVRVRGEYEERYFPL